VQGTAADLVRGQGPVPEAVEHQRIWSASSHFSQKRGEMGHPWVNGGHGWESA
jgi:hypothetical protein